MAVLSGEDGGSIVFPSVAAAADAISAVSEKHGFRVSSTGGSVKCSRAGQPRGKEDIVGKQQRDRTSLKCGCGFSLSVWFCPHLPLDAGYFW